MTSTPERQRIDKWLWHARVVKTRTLAQKLVTGGKVRINREKILAVSTPVKAGDVVTIALRARVRILRIQAFRERRGSPETGRELYEELTAPAIGAAGNPDATPAGAGTNADGGAAHPGGLGVGRPGKRDRRKLLALKKFDNP